MDTPTYKIEGRPVSLPCHVQEASSGAALFLVPLEAARALMPGPDFTVAEFLPGKAICTIAMIDYKQNDLGDYNEVSIALFVRPKGQRPLIPWLGNWMDLSRNKLGVHILHLPVDQSFTCEAGRKIWGYQKTVQEIDIDYQTDRARCKLVYDGQSALTFSVPRGGDKSRKPGPMTTFSYIDGKPFRTMASQSVKGFGTHKGADVELELGAGPIADQLRSLGLPKKPIASIWMEHMSAEFGPPQAL
ncbi:MAG: acetoacetate decarboxylase family protein [Hyphomonadaceae bacterium]